MSEALHTAIQETKYGYKDENPSQEDFLATFRSFYLELCVTGKDDNLSMEQALRRASVVYVDDVA